jgi:hypothetical protein
LEGTQGEGQKQKSFTFVFWPSIAGTMRSSVIVLIHSTEPKGDRIPPGPLGDQNNWKARKVKDKNKSPSLLFF